MRHHAEFGVTETYDEMAVDLRVVRKSDEVESGAGAGFLAGLLFSLAVAYLYQLVSR